MRIHVKKMTFSAMFLAIALVLPFLTGQISSIGNMLCPMHLPVLLCGFLCGWPWGLAVGLVAPLFRTLLFGMPPLLTAIPMAFELATYGFLTGLLFRLIPRKMPCVYMDLVLAMIGGRIVWGIVRFFLAGLGYSEFSFEIFLSGALLTAIPGMVLQLVLIPLIVYALQRAKLMPYD